MHAKKCWLTVVTALTCTVLVSGCANNDRHSGVHVSTSVHYGHYWGHPWYGYSRPIIIVPPETEIDPDWGTERPSPPQPQPDVDPDYGVAAPSEPEAMPLPEMPDMGMPDDGGDMGMGMDMDMDLGGFD